MAEYALKYSGSQIDGYLDKVKDLFNLIYPVGSLYMSMNATNPSSLFGGTWEQIEGRFILAAGDGYNAGSIDGAATVTLTVDQMPNHTHVHNDYIDGYVSPNYRIDKDTYETPCRQISGGDRQAVGGQSSSTGGGQPHNNMPPYLVAYIWKRTA